MRKNNNSQLIWVSEGARSTQSIRSRFALIWCGVSKYSITRSDFNRRDASSIWFSLFPREQFTSTTDSSIHQASLIVFFNVRETTTIKRRENSIKISFSSSQKCMKLMRICMWMKRFFNLTALEGRVWDVRHFKLLVKFSFVWKKIQLRCSCENIREVNPNL